MLVKFNFKLNSSWYLIAPMSTRHVRSLVPVFIPFPWRFRLVPSLLCGYRVHLLIL